MPDYTTDQNEIAPYLTDESSAFRGSADRLYRPSTADEICSILRQATEKETPVTVSGAGTSITGARVPAEGGWILASDRLRQIDSSSPNSPGTEHDSSWEELSTGDALMLVNRDMKLARIPAGVRLAEIDEMLRPTGLCYPPDPTEMSAMIGGTVATNASGARSYHFGPTRSWVEALALVTPTGTAVGLRRGEDRACGSRLDLGGSSPITLPQIALTQGVKNAAGYFLAPDMDAVDLFVGGEGTLGVITEVEVRLSPRPVDTVTLTVFLSERDGALELADAARLGALEPGTVLSIEYFDEGSLDFIRVSYPETPRAAAAVVFEVTAMMSGAPGTVGNDRAPVGPPHLFGIGPAVSATWKSVIEPFTPVDVWVTLPGEREQMRLFRHSLPERVNEYVRNRHGKLGTDLAVPDIAFREMITAYDNASDSGVRTVLFGHLGDYHLHLNFLADTMEEMACARGLYATLARTAVELGGTISGEHGVGKKRIEVGDRAVPYLELMFSSDDLRALQSVKQQIDPAWILNRGTMIPRASER